MEITLDLIESHGLTTEEYEQIRKRLGREPNLTELGIFSVMWSEHCSYKSSRLHLKSFPPRDRKYSRDRVRTPVSSISETG